MFNAEFIQVLNMAIEKVSERKDIYISISATDEYVSITVYPYWVEVEE